MQTVLKDERSRIGFDVKKLKKFLYGADLENIEKAVKNLVEKLPVNPNIYNEGRVEMMKEAIRQMPHVLNSLTHTNSSPMIAMFLHSQFQSPGSVHYGMFIICLKLLGTDEMYEELIPKCSSGEIIGCYAQTEMGHGSDVQSLTTTATFDAKTDEIILNSPNIAAMKFWPGELGVFANHAIVFAKLIVDGNEMGVHSFLLRIRDQNSKPLPGIQCGDIGPHYGYITKDNGFMRITNVRIPRKNMLSKVVGLGADGSLEVKGNPKIVYATMMLVRKAICSVWPKMYASAITIASRYSLFRKQFKNEAGQEQPIIDYQTQQNKLIPLLAEYYAITVTGHRIDKLTDTNFGRMMKKNDDSLMAETHACLSFGKSYFSDVVQRGIEICRLSCGGHGYSQYSGLPAIVVEYAPNITHEGENTVMYLQVSRYILKCFNNVVVKKQGVLQKSVRYLESFEYLTKKKCTVTDPENWTIEEVRLLLAQTTCSILHTINQRYAANKDKSKKAQNNEDLGMLLVDLAISHSIYNTYYAFEQAIVKFPDEIIKRILFDMCLIYGIGNILQRPYPLITIEAVQPEQINSLLERKQLLLKKLRPHLMGLVDSCAVPDAALKSAISTGDGVYESLLDLAKKNSLNQNFASITAANIVKDGMARARL